MYLNTGIESNARGEELALASQYPVFGATQTTVKNWAGLWATGNNLLTYDTFYGHWTNTTGRTIMVTFSYYLYLQGSTGYSQAWIVKNGSGFTTYYGGAQGTGQDNLNGSAVVYLAVNENIQIEVYANTIIGGVYGGAYTDKSTAKVSYIIHA